MNTRQSLNSLVTPTIVAIFDEANNQLSQELQYTKLGYSDFSDLKFDSPEFQNISGAGEAVLTLEGSPYVPEDLIQNYKTTLVLKKYTKQMSVTEELVHWIQVGNTQKVREFKGTAKAMANGLNQKVDVEATKLYYLGFGTTFQTGGDGKALFATDHPSPDTSVAAQRNVPAAAYGHEALSAESLEHAVQAINRYQDVKGVQLMRCRKLKLIIPRELEETAKRILFSTQGPLTANLGINPMATQHSRVTYEVADWIPTAYATYWFLIDEERASDCLYMLWGWKPRVNDEHEYSNGTLYKAGSVFFKPGFVDWRFAYGSKGDATSSA
jgi:hypothetical protein